MMACHAARVIRQRHKAEHDMLETDLSPEQRKVLEEAFEAADKNGDGILSADEYFDIFQSHGLTIDREWIERTIARNDKDGDGGISLEEFIEMNIRSRARNADRNSGSAGIVREASVSERARLAFNVYDRNRDGFLTKAELRRTSKKMTEAQIDAVFEKYDKNRDGKLDFDEFRELMEANAKSKRDQQELLNQQEKQLHLQEKQQQQQEKQQQQQEKQQQQQEKQQQQQERQQQQQERQEKQQQEEQQQQQLERQQQEEEEEQQKEQEKQQQEEKEPEQ